VSVVGTGAGAEKVGSWELVKDYGAWARKMVRACDECKTRTFVSGEERMNPSNVTGGEEERRSSVASSSSSKKSARAMTR
jgi:hypothetical protein